MDKEFEGKYAVVTGGAGGISYEAAKTLAKKGLSGVVLADLNIEQATISAQKLEEETGCHCYPCKVDVSIPQDIEHLFEFALEKMPNVHGAPVQMGDPEAIGVTDIMNPDYGEAVDIYPGEIPVFWPCGVTPQAAVENAKPPIVITHAPGHMFITDILNTELNDYLEAQKNK